MRTYLTEAIKDYKIKLSEEQFSQFERYFELLCEWNEKINLTAITDPKGVAVKHFADSLVVCDELNLDAELIHSRAEEGGQDLDLREGFDLVVSRAVAQLNILSEYCIPYVRLSGSFVAFKGTAEGEIKAAKKAIGILGGRIKNIHTFELPLVGSGRTLVEIEKVALTPDKYPRQNGKIKSKPL